MIQKYEGTRELEKLWNLCFKVSKVGPDAQTRNEAKAHAENILSNGPRIGFVEIDTETVEMYEKILTQHRL